MKTIKTLLIMVCFIAQQVQAMKPHKNKKNTPVIQHLINAGSQKEKYNKLLLEAAKNGDADKIITALQNGAEIETAENYATPLILALSHKNDSAAQLLIRRGANIKAADPAGTTLHHAAKHGHAEILKFLLTKGIDKNAKNYFQSTPLHYAAQGGYIETVKILINANADINAKNHYQIIPLHFAAEQGHSEIVKTLLAAKAEKNAKGRYQYSPLHYCATQGHAEIVQLLLDAGVKKDAKDENQLTALHHAADLGHTQVTKLLLEAGLNKDAKDKLQYTPLHYASQKGHVEIVKLLLNDKAGISAVGQLGFTPLHFAVLKGHAETVKLLLEAGSFKNPCSDYPISSNHPSILSLLLEYDGIIHESSRSAIVKALGCESKPSDLLRNFILGKPEITRQLLQLKQKAEDINFKDKAGMSTLMYAAAYNNMDIVKALLNYGKDKDVYVDALAQNSMGQTALSIASTHNNSKVAHLIKKYLSPFKHEIIQALKLYNIDKKTAKIVVAYLIGEHFDTCAYCKEKNADQKCCNNIYYCSKACQKQHWAEHKPNCKQRPNIVIEEVD